MTLVEVVMGSQSDWDTMEYCSEELSHFGVPHEVRIISAHRTPERLFQYAKEVEERGLKVLIAGAGGAAHLPGMLASLTLLPVLGVPIETQTLGGMDSLLSIVQMPFGTPVGTLAIGTTGARNAAIFAIQILTLENIELKKKLKQFRTLQTINIAETPR